MNKDNFKNKKDFDIPEGYFDNFQDRLFQKINEIEDTPVLNNIKKNGDGFMVPTHYFDNVYNKVNLKNQQKPITNRVINLNQWVYIGIAASILAFVIATSIITNNDKFDEQLAYADMQEYLDNDLVDYDSYELADLLELENDQLSNLNELNFNDDTVIEYLTDQTETYDVIIDNTLIDDIN
ncbi:hypothetical protein ABN763_11300 [Spongiivirga sp. MCCC 1A20706]|uniref:hypothetical protein n=1 Tax=Spongiivirga sp. MCCC 1A20706 TaxID=3160963 RepID=UPI00397739BA